MKPTSGLLHFDAPSNSAGLAFDESCVRSITHACHHHHDRSVEITDAAQMYPNFSVPKGYCLIISNRTFELPTLRERFGTDVDAQNMETLFTKLGYETKLEKDLTAAVREIGCALPTKTLLFIQEMKGALETFGKMREHEKCHSAVVVILTHGNNGLVTL